MEPQHLWDIDHPYYCNESAETLEESRGGGWSLTGRKIWVTPRTGLAA